MYKIVLFSSLFLLSFSSIGQSLPQKLTIKQLIMLFNSDQSDADDFMTSRNWAFHTAQQETDNYYASITWAFNKRSYDNQALAFVRKDISNGNSNISVTYQHSSPEILKALKAEIASYGMVKVKSGIYDNGEGIYTDYKGKNYAVRIRTYGGEHDSGYNIIVYTKEHYYLNIVKSKFLWDLENLYTSPES